MIIHRVMVDVCAIILTFIRCLRFNFKVMKEDCMEKGFAEKGFEKGFIGLRFVVVLFLAVGMVSFGYGSADACSDGANFESAVAERAASERPDSVVAGSVIADSVVADSVVAGSVIADTVVADTVVVDSVYAERVGRMALERKIPVIQVAYKTPERSVVFERAQYDFVKESEDVETVFQAASISKVVFSYIVMRMVDRGEIDLDRPLHEYIGGLEERFLDAFPEDPELEGRNRAWAEQLTARIVLTHGTGLPNWMTKGRHGEGKLIFKCEPDTDYTYSGEGIHYLQRVVEHITGKSLEELAIKEVFEPFGMEHSSYRWKPEFDYLAADGYTAKVENGGKASGNVDNAAFTLRTNVKDFSKFLDALMEGRGLTSETFNAMMTPYRNLDKEGMFFGLGIRVTPTASNYGRVWSHGGSNRNFRCKFWVFPDRKSYLIYFTNSANGGGGTRKDLLEIFVPDYNRADL